MFAVVGVLIIATWRLRPHYTQASKKTLDISGDHPDKFTAIEILAQRGHANAATILLRNLIYKKESADMKIKILETLGRMQEPTTIPEIIGCFGDEHKYVKLAAVRALEQFQNLGKHFYSQAFTRYRVITALQELFEKENSKEVRSHIVRVFANMHQAEVVPFLLQTLEHEDPDVRADCVFVCGLFQDISVAHYVTPHLQSEHPFVRASAIIALWQFPQYRLKLTIMLTSLLESRDPVTQKAVIHLLGEIGAIQEKPRLLKFLESEDDELRLLSALALAKMHHEHVSDILADYVVHADEHLAERAKRHMRNVPAHIREAVETKVHHKLSRRLDEILESIEAASIEEIPESTLGDLKRVYADAGQLEEVAKINTLLASHAEASKLALAV